MINTLLIILVLLLGLVLSLGVWPDYPNWLKHILIDDACLGLASFVDACI